MPEGVQEDDMGELMWAYSWQTPATYSSGWGIGGCKRGGG